MNGSDLNPKGLLEHLIAFSLTNKLIMALLTLGLILWGFMVAPFNWHLFDLPRDPVPVDAIPDLGENQQIVFTQWMGRSPQDVEDQITYPLTTALLGVPGVETVRSQSFFGFSSIYVIFQEHVDFYWSRSRLLEKLNSLPAGTLPPQVQPSLGPDATGLGQIYWYTLEGRDEKGQPTGGWDLDELRSIQDWFVRYAFMGVAGVSEVASIGGYVREYQIDVNPEALQVHSVSLQDIFRAVQMSNQDVGARNMEINQVEYFIRGVGVIQNLDDLRYTVVKAKNNVPVYIKDLAKVNFGPAQRRGILDKGGAEVVGGVVVARFGENPLAVIQRLKAKIKDLEPGMPTKTLADGRLSKLQVVPFYDRSGLINETLETLNTALSQQVLITIFVILLMLLNGRSASLISGLLPLAVLISFIAMKIAGVNANIVALSGIAIAIGTMVDMGIVMVENIVAGLKKAPENQAITVTVFHACREVSSAVLTAVATTIISFLPVLTMVAAEGKLFKPLAYTKTFALIAAVGVSVFLLPPLACLLFSKARKARIFLGISIAIVLFCLLAMVPRYAWWLVPVALAWGVQRVFKQRLGKKGSAYFQIGQMVFLVCGVAYLLAVNWLPLGLEKGKAANIIFVCGLIGTILLFFRGLMAAYPYVLGWALKHRLFFFAMPLIILVMGQLVWTGSSRTLRMLPDSFHQSRVGFWLATQFPGLGKEFMPNLDEGSFLFMPTTSVHAAINEAKDVLQKQDMAFSQIPEVESAVGKLGRVDSSLDPAPISMIETIIQYKPKYLKNADGNVLLFAFDSDEKDLFRHQDGKELAAPDGAPYWVQGTFLRDENNALVPDTSGKPFRLWRPPLDPSLNPDRKPWPGIQTEDDLWQEIARVGKIPGTTAAPKLQPIAARLVMLQSGMRAPMGIKIKGPNLQTIEQVGLEIEKWLKKHPAIRPETVIADRIIGKPYLEFELNRMSLARYGILLEQAQHAIEMAIGGKTITTTIEGRQRYDVRVRYQRERRDTLEKIKQILIPTGDGGQIPLIKIADLQYTKGPQVIKSEDTFLTSYVIFDKQPGRAEVDVVAEASDFLQQKLNQNAWTLPAGVSYEFTGSYKNQVRASKKLLLVLPLSLVLIFIILYLQFRSLPTTFWIFSSIGVAWAGGFIFIWLYGQPWFLNTTIMGQPLQELFGIGPMNLSVAVWVGFLALFGIASDDGVLIATYLDQSFAENRPQTIDAIHQATLQAGIRRVRPALMTSATTIIALLPILTSSGRGSDIMKPMALPTFGGMLVVLITLFMVPVLYATTEELKLHFAQKEK